MILEIQNLSKSYGSILALDKVSFEVPQGSIFGILGPNGSGKTTLLGILLDVLKANAGSISWTLDNQILSRKNMGTLLETPNFYHYLNAVDNLKVVAQIKNISNENIDEVLKTVRLYNRRFSPFKTFSLGMKQRLAIASALLSNPPVLIFDEPTNGLDPEGISDIRSLLINLHQQGKTIILASHLLHEVEQVCTHVAILKKGKLIQVGNVNEILNENDTIEISCDNLQFLIEVLNKYEGINKIKQSGKLVSFESEKYTAKEINKICSENNIWIDSLRTKKASLESKFIEITQP